MKNESSAKCAGNQRNSHNNLSANQSRAQECYLFCSLWLVSRKEWRHRWKMIQRMSFGAPWRCRLARQKQTQACLYFSAGSKNRLRHFRTFTKTTMGEREQVKRRNDGHDGERDTPILQFAHTFCILCCVIFVLYSVVFFQSMYAIYNPVNQNRR